MLIRVLLIIALCRLLLSRVIINTISFILRLVLLVLVLGALFEL